MAQRRFFIPPGHIHAGRAVLPPDQAHHLRHVLRLQPDSEIELFDGLGKAYRGTVGFEGDSVCISGLRQLALSDCAHPCLTLAVALIKADKFELVLQKATELGVDEIAPLATRLCSARIPESRVQRRLERWERIILEASKQCRRNAVPVLRRPAAFADFLAEERAPCAGFLLFEGAEAAWPAEIPAAVQAVLCIGPEGGWHPSELEMARAAGYRIIGLGPRILRAETAAIAAVTLFQLGSILLAGKVSS
jgi:16S rRNA (uracil1498-N3)-methyltransferase